MHKKYGFRKIQKSTKFGPNWGPDLPKMAFRCRKKGPGCKQEVPDPFFMHFRSDFGRFFDFLSDKYRLHYLNIGNILDCDINEYKSLLEFIDEEPINNYEYLTKDMIEKVYKKYV